MVDWLVLVGSYLPRLLLRVSFYEPFSSMIFVFPYVCSFVNHCSGEDPVANLDIQFIVESEPIDLKFKNTSRNLDI